MPVFRMTPLPTGVNRGRLIVATDVAECTRTKLQQSCGTEGRHEGVVLWLGRKSGDDALVLGAYSPRSDHGPQHVHIHESEIGPMNRHARGLGLVLVAQVHSHPGNDTRHSDGDDRLILMPHEGMFSLVVGNYGDGHIVPQNGSGVHQYQDGRWVQITKEYESVILAPAMECVV